MFHSGAETTPVRVNNHLTFPHTVEQHHVQCLLDLELTVQDDEAEAHGEHVVGGALLEERPQGLEGLLMGEGLVGNGKLVACSRWPTDNRGSRRV